LRQWVRRAETDAGGCGVDDTEANLAALWWAIAPSNDPLRAVEDNRSISRIIVAWTSIQDV
jgi:hypothetical protein